MMKQQQEAQQLKQYYSTSQGQKKEQITTNLLNNKLDLKSPRNTNSGNDSKGNETPISNIQTSSDEHPQVNDNLSFSTEALANGSTQQSTANSAGARSFFNGNNGI